MAQTEDKEIEYQTDYLITGAAKGSISEAQLIAIKTYIELGFPYTKIERLTGVPADTIGRLNRGKFGRLHEVAADPLIKKHWDERRRKFINAAYAKVEDMLNSVDAGKIEGANLKDTVNSIAVLVQQIVNMVGHSKQTTETTEEIGVVKNMSNEKLEQYIESATKALGVNGGVLLRRTRKTTVEESQVGTPEDGEPSNYTSNYDPDPNNDNDNDLDTGTDTRSTGGEELPGAVAEGLEITSIPVAQVEESDEEGTSRGSNRAPATSISDNGRTNGQGGTSGQAGHTGPGAVLHDERDSDGEDGRAKFRKVADGVISAARAHPLEAAKVDSDPDGTGHTPVYEEPGENGTEKAPGDGTG